jgi:hypothetical protein
LDDTTSKKAHNEQAAYMFGFKCFLYTSSTDDLLCYPPGRGTRDGSTRGWQVAMSSL